MTIQTFFEGNIHLPDLSSFMCGPSKSTAHHPTILITNPAMVGPYFHVKMVDQSPGLFEEPQVVWDAVYQSKTPGVIDNDARLISHHFMPKTREFLGFCPKPRSHHKYTMSVSPSDVDGKHVIAPSGVAVVHVTGSPSMLVNKFL